MARKRAARPRPRDESAKPDPERESVKPDPERERVPILGSLRGEVMVFQPMTILDISRGGAQIETAFPLQLDSLHDFRLTLNDQSIVVKGRVAHCHIGDLEEERVGYRTGVEFIEPPEHVRHAVMEFIETLKAQRKR